MTDQLAFFQLIRASLFGRMTQSQVDGLNALLEASEGLPVSWRAYLLATAYLETAFTMQPIHERGGRSYFDKYEPGTRLGKTLGNIYPGDGFRFRGRGYVQLTGRTNYTKATEKIGVDFIADPDLALKQEYAARIAVEGMADGWFTGKRFADYLPGDYVNARRIINGLDKAQTIAGYAQTFETALTA